MDKRSMMVDVQEDAEVDEENEATIGYMKLKTENEAGQMFQRRVKKQLESIRKAPVFSRGYIRFKFPDMFILQIAFSPSETMQFIYTFLKPVLKLG